MVYIDYENALKKSNLDSLVERRARVCLKFAKACTKNEAVKNIFSLNPVEYHLETRDREVFHVVMVRTERYRKSAVPYMMRLLNENT